MGAAGIMVERFACRDVNKTEGAPTPPHLMKAVVVLAGTDGGHCLTPASDPLKRSPGKESIKSRVGGKHRYLALWTGAPEKEPTLSFSTDLPSTPVGTTTRYFELQVILTDGASILPVAIASLPIRSDKKKRSFDLPLYPIASIQNIQAHISQRAKQPALVAPDRSVYDVDTSDAILRVEVEVVETTGAVLAHLAADKTFVAPFHIAPEHNAIEVTRDFARCTSGQSCKNAPACGAFSRTDSASSLIDEKKEEDQMSPGDKLRKLDAEIRLKYASSSRPASYKAQEPRGIEIVREPSICRPTQDEEETRGVGRSPILADLKEMERQRSSGSRSEQSPTRPPVHPNSRRTMSSPPPPPPSYPPPLSPPKTSSDKPTSASTKNNSIVASTQLDKTTSKVEVKSKQKKGTKEECQVSKKGNGNRQSRSKGDDGTVQSEEETYYTMHTFQTAESTPTLDTKATVSSKFLGMIPWDKIDQLLENMPMAKLKVFQFADGDDGDETHYNNEDHTWYTRTVTEYGSLYPNQERGLFFGAACWNQRVDGMDRAYCGETIDDESEIDEMFQKPKFDHEDESTAEPIWSPDDQPVPPRFKVNESSEPKPAGGGGDKRDVADEKEATPLDLRRSAHSSSESNKRRRALSQQRVQFPRSALKKNPKHLPRNPTLSTPIEVIASTKDGRDRIVIGSGSSSACDNESTTSTPRTSVKETASEGSPNSVAEFPVKAASQKVLCHAVETFLDGEPLEDSNARTLPVTIVEGIKDGDSVGELTLTSHEARVDLQKAIRPIAPKVTFKSGANLMSVFSCGVPDEEKPALSMASSFISAAYVDPEMKAAAEAAWAKRKAEGGIERRFHRN